MSVTIQTDGGHCLPEWEIAASPATGSVQHLLQGWSPGLLDQPTQEILLERPAFGCGPAAQNSVDFIGDVLDLYASHGAIMAP